MAIGAHPIERMADLESVVCTVTEVEFPLMRREVMTALAALTDLEYQQRVWIERIYPTETYYDDFDANIHTLFDDCRVLPQPESQLRTILYSGDEIPRLRQLGEILNRLLDARRGAPDAEYINDAAWPEMARVAGLALAAMTLANALS